MDCGHLKQYLIGITVTIFFTMSGMVYGWAAPMTYHFQSSNSEILLNAEESSWVIASLELGAIFTPIICGIIADKKGRKFVILSVTIPLYLISWTLIIVTRSFKYLIIARLIQGMAMGIIFCVNPAYLGEIAEPQLRGKILSLCMILWYIGILFSYSVGPYVSYNMFSFILVSLPVISIVGYYCIPESPYFLVTKRKFSQAEKNLRVLRNYNDEQISSEIALIKATVADSYATKMHWTALITNKICRKSIFLPIIILGTEYCGGITVMYTYSTEIFSLAGTTLLSPEESTIFLGWVCLVSCIAIGGVVDRFGRKPLLIISSAGSAVSMLLIGLFFFIQNKTEINISNHNWILLFAITMYYIFVNIGLVPVLFIYVGEIIPIGIKGIACGIVNTATAIASFMTIKMFFVINTNFGIHVAFILFSVNHIIGCILITKFIIETKCKTLFQIQEDLKNIRTDSRKFTTKPNKLLVTSEMDSL